MERRRKKRGFEVVMRFEAELKGSVYQIEVNETKDYWDIRLGKDGVEPDKYQICKTDYQELDGAISFLFEGSSYMLDVDGDGIDHKVYCRGSYREIPIYNDEALLHESLKGGGSMAGGKVISAGMPGKIVKVSVVPGQSVKEKDPVLVMEAMKMENEIKASADAVVKEVLVKAGDSVESGATLVVFE